MATRLQLERTRPSSSDRSDAAASDSGDSQIFSALLGGARRSPTCASSSVSLPRDHESTKVVKLVSLDTAAAWTRMTLLAPDAVVRLSKTTSGAPLLIGGGLRVGGTGVAEESWRGRRHSSTHSPSLAISTSASRDRPPGRPAPALCAAHSKPPALLCDWH